MALRDHPNLAYLVVFCGVLGHASSEFFAVLSGVAGPEVSVWRYTVGGAGLVVWALLRPGSRDLVTPLREEGPRLVLLGVLGISVAYLAFHWALDFATVVQVGTLITTMPIFIGLLNLWINKEPFQLPKIVAGTFAVLGIALLLTDGYLARLAGNERQLVGLGLTMVCAVFGSGYAVMAKPMINRYGAVRITAITMAIGGLGLWLVVGLAWEAWVNPIALFALPPQAAWSLATLALVNTTLTQVLFFGGLAAVPDLTRGGYLFFLKPVIAALLSFWFLSQPITWMQLLAIAMVCASVGGEAMAARWLRNRRSR